MLKAAGLPLIEGGIDMPQATNKSAEEMYEILKEKKQQNQQNEANKNNDYQQQEGQQSKAVDQHKMWEEAVRRAEREQQKSKLIKCQLWQVYY